MKNFYSLILIAAVILFFGSCQKDLPSESKINQSPSTRLWITSDSLLNETVSRQHIYFYGEDPDGYVTGYLIAFIKDSTGSFAQNPNLNILRYVWTTLNDTIIALPLLQKKDKFTIIVRAVDDRFNPASISNGALITGFPSPYWDKDSNGTFSAADTMLQSLQDAVDPKGVVQLFPIKNTPPTVRFGITNDDNASTIEQPETTYTVATFSFQADDLDGKATLTGFRIALNDSTDAAEWTELRATDTLVTLIVPKEVSDNATGPVEAEIYSGLFNNNHMVNTGKKISNLRLNAENVLYLEAKDIAGEFSKRVRMPSTASRKWYVKKPQSRMLIVADYNPTTPSGFNDYIIKYYRNLFSDSRIVNGLLKDFDVVYRNNIPSYMNPALIKTLLLYDVVLWYTDINPSLLAAQIGLRSYTDNGGKVIFTTQFKDKNNATYLYSDLIKLRDFLPLDPEKVITDSIPFIGNRFYVKDQKTGINVKVIPLQSGYPVLYSDSISTGGGQPAFHTGVAFRKIFKDNDSQYLYTTDSSHTTPPDYIGELEISCIDNQKRIVMFAMPLHILNGWEHNLPLFFKQVIENEFGIH